VSILLEDGTTYARQGKLQFTDVTVDPSTGNFLLRALVPNPGGVLLPGMYVRAVIDEGVQEQGVLVPQQGIAHDPKGNATALVVNAAGKVEQRTVDISRAVGDDWLVDQGLSSGDRLIISGLQKVQPGMLVQAVEDTSGSAAGYAGGSADASAAHSPMAR
jgi:membrane fusion protein (multidrug efflux system)